MATQIFTFDGSSGTDLTAYDANFVALTAAQELNGSGAAISSGSITVYYYDASQTGLAQTSKITATIKADSGEVANAPCVHIKAGQTGLCLYINVVGSNIENCNIRSINAAGAQSYLANISNPDIINGVNQSIEYEIITREGALPGTVDVDARIDGTLYEDLVTGYTQLEGFPGQCIYDTATTIDTLEVTVGAATAKQVSCNTTDGTELRDSLRRLITGDTYLWSIVDGSTIEEEGSDTITSGNVTLLLPSTSLNSGDPVKVYIKKGDVLGVYDRDID